MESSVTQNSSAQCDVVVSSVCVAYAAVTWLVAMPDSMPYVVSWVSVAVTSSVGDVARAHDDVARAPPSQRALPETSTRRRMDVQRIVARRQARMNVWRGNRSRK